MIAKMMTLTELIVNAQAAYRSMDNPQISEAEFIADFIQSYYFSFSRDWEAVCKALQLPTDTQEAELK